MIVLGFLAIASVAQMVVIAATNSTIPAFVFEIVVKAGVSGSLNDIFVDTLASFVDGYVAR